VSESCKKYLRKGAVLVANNSYGDASLASIDKDYRLIAAIQQRGEMLKAKRRANGTMDESSTASLAPGIGGNT
jgi:hypothetical protein